MTNPTPRPALRKAKDATVHPAAPAPARTQRRPVIVEESPAIQVAPATELVEEPPAAAAAAPAAESAPRKRASTKRGFRGATSDHMRPSESGAMTTPELEPNKSKREAKHESAKSDLMTGKSAELTIEIPKKLRKEVKTTAKRRNVELDTVVATLLLSWLDND